MPRLRDQFVLQVQKEMDQNLIMFKGPLWYDQLTKLLSQFSFLAFDLLSFHCSAKERTFAQVFGFFFLVTGIFLYSDVLIMPAIRRFAE